MRLYLVSGNSDKQRRIWVGSQGDAAKARKELIADGFKRAELITEEVDIDTKKEGLLAFLNANCN